MQNDALNFYVFIVLYEHAMENVGCRAALEKEFSAVQCVHCALPRRDSRGPSLPSCSLSGSDYFVSENSQQDL